MNESPSTDTRGRALLEIGREYREEENITGFVGGMTVAEGGRTSVRGQSTPASCSVKYQMRFTIASC